MAQEKFRIKRISRIMRKFKKVRGLRSKYVLAEFENPVMELLRRNMRSEIYEASNKNKLKQGKFVFDHSDGKEREVELNDAYAYTADYGGKTYKKYIMHEDWAYPIIPKIPLLEFKRMQNAIHNAMSAELKWKAEEKKATAKQIMAIVALVAVIVGGYILYVMLKPAEKDVPPPAQQLLYNASTQTIQIISSTV